MAAIDILIDQIVKSPGQSLVRTGAAPSMVWSTPGPDDQQWAWFDSSHDTLAGLEVIEHPDVSQALCQAVFQTPARRSVR